jgi:hypothetical protein
MHLFNFLNQVQSTRTPNPSQLLTRHHRPVCAALTLVAHPTWLSPWAHRGGSSRGCCSYTRSVRRDVQLCSPNLCHLKSSWCSNSIFRYKIWQKEGSQHFHESFYRIAIGGLKLRNMRKEAKKKVSTHSFKTNPFSCKECILYPTSLTLFFSTCKLYMHIISHQFFTHANYSRHLSPTKENYIS